MPSPTPIETYFIHLLYDAKKVLDNAIFEKFGKMYTVPKLRRKYNWLIKLHRDFFALLQQTWIGWDSITNIIAANEDTWQKLLNVQI